MNFSADSENFCTFAFFGTDFCKFLRALIDDNGNVCIRFNVVQNGRFAEKTFNRGERRTRTRFASVTFDRSHKRCFLTAYKRTCAETDMQIKVKARIKDVFAEHTVFFRLLDSNLKSCNGDRILRSDVNITLGSADCIACDSHSLDYRVGVALKDRSVHKRTGVALVRVTGNIFLIVNRFSGKAPFQAGGESAATSASQAGFQNFIYNLLRFHRG